MGASAIRVSNLTGAQGSKVVADTTPATQAAGKFWQALQVINAAEIDSITDASTEDVADLEGLTLPAGLVIYGRISALTLTSGVVKLYNE